jgi:hypothetical protein
MTPSLHLKSQPLRSVQWPPSTLLGDLGSLEVATGRSATAPVPSEVVLAVDKNDVRLTILASVILVGVPVIASVVQDLRSGRLDEQLGRRRRSQATGAGGVAPHLRGIPLEQLAADLRRLRRAVATDQQRSATHQLANRVAYDQLLMQACEMLAVPHELDKKTAGPGRDIERIRVEAELERAGIVLSAAGRSG